MLFDLLRRLNCDCLDSGKFFKFTCMPVDNNIRSQSVTCQMFLNVMDGGINIHAGRHELFYLNDSPIFLFCFFVNCDFIYLKPLPACSFFNIFQMKRNNISFSVVSCVNEERLGKTKRSRFACSKSSANALSSIPLNVFPMHSKKTL